MFFQSKLCLTVVMLSCIYMFMYMYAYIFAYIYAKICLLSISVFYQIHQKDGPGNFFLLYSKNHYFIYLKSREGEREKGERLREMFHPLAHSLNGGQGWG